MKKFKNKKVLANKNIWEIVDGKAKLKDSVDPKDLVSVVIPDGVKEIDENCFKNCFNLEKVVLPSSVETFHKDCFIDCYYLDYIYVCNANNNIPKALPRWINCVAKTKNRFVFSYVRYDENGLIDKKPNSYYLKSPLLANYYIKNFDNPEKFKKLDMIRSLGLIEYFCNRNKDNVYDETVVDDMLNKNIKNYNLLIKQLGELSSRVYNSELIRLCDILGVFETNPIETKRISKSGKEIVERVDYAQKAREFIKEKLTKACNLYFMFDFDENMNDGFKKPFADFMFTHFDDVIAQGATFLHNCYNRFEEAQDAHTKNKGSCRQLAPTIDFFLQYFDESKFAGVNKETKNISDVIGKYYDDQTIFDRAVQVVKANASNNIPQNILKNDLKQKLDSEAEKQFKKLKTKISKIESINKETLTILQQVAEYKFTYEFLKKNDVLNLVLGKLCNCCAHLDGVGDGIAISAMLEPDIQNLVIRDDFGNIVAKATLYVNRKQGYGICNSFQVNTKVMYNYSNSIAIYNKLKQGLTDFATEYNKIYTPKLKTINVGMGLNDLSDHIKEHDVEASHLLKPFNFKKYSRLGDEGYEGDAKLEQYTVWSYD